MGGSRPRVQNKADRLLGLQEVAGLCHLNTAFGLCVHVKWRSCHIPDLDSVILAIGEESLLSFPLAKQGPKVISAFTAAGSDC